MIQNTISGWACLPAGLCDSAERNQAFDRPLRPRDTIAWPMVSTHSMVRSGNCDKEEGDDAQTHNSVRPGSGSGGFGVCAGGYTAQGGPFRNRRASAVYSTAAVNSCCPDGGGAVYAAPRLLGPSHASPVVGYSPLTYAPSTYTALRGV